MAMKIKYPVGIQTFSEIISEGYVYVDKTALIYDLVDTSKYVFLSRPRRFGKSLLMSTIEAYFQGKKELFEGLKIDVMEKKWDEFPVLRFDFSGNNFSDSQRMIEHIVSYLNEFDKIWSIHTHGNISSRFRELIREVARISGKKVVILIDEYDKPILDCLEDTDLNSQMKAELRGFYSVIKSSDQYIKFAMLTGITKFGKISVFSGINNLRDISMLPKYNGICGITDTEFHTCFEESIQTFADENGISPDVAWKAFKYMYDGYHFSVPGEYVYNPFSVLNAFNDGRISSYWYASGCPSYLIKVIERYSYRFDELDGEMRNEIELSDISDLAHDIVPLLYQSGYLTIKGAVAGPDSVIVPKEYILTFPNHEVNKAFWESLARRFFRGVDGRIAFNVSDCIQDIRTGEAENFMLRIQALFADTSSEPERNKEIHFQNMMAIACKMMGLFVMTEIHSAAGRCDMRILTDCYIYLFEFKIDATPEEAMAQIKEKGYAIPFSADSRTKILIGANFSTQTRTLDNWIIEKF